MTGQQPYIEQTDLVIPKIAGILGGLESGDDSGQDTFARYRYQAKCATLRWLSTLSSTGPLAVVCETIDDFTSIYPDRLHFTQVKSRSRGVWTPYKIAAAGGGLDALIRSYTIAGKGADNLAIHLELLLEGPASDTTENAAFFADPRTASEKIRVQLVPHGLPGPSMDDFLGRLKIKTQFHSRASIDAVTLRILGVLLPGATNRDTADLYCRLLEATQDAQAAEPGNESSWEMFIHAADPSGNAAQNGDVAVRALTGPRLRSILRLADAVVDEPALEPSSEDYVGLSNLELKLRAAGGSKTTIDDAKLQRALAEVVKQEALARKPEAAVDLDSLALSLLTYARAVGQDVQIQSASAPAAAGRSADLIFSRLMQRTTDLKALDSRGLFNREPFGLVGYLCELSDECRFSWTVA